MTKKYVVRPTAAEREWLENLVGRGRIQAYRINRANILLAVDADGASWDDEQAAEALGCHLNTVFNVRQPFVGVGFKAALERNKQPLPPRQRVLDGEKEARLIAVACSKPPAGVRDGRCKCWPTKS
jgi:hypothetical protein